MSRLDRNVDVNDRDPRDRKQYDEQHHENRKEDGELEGRGAAIEAMMGPWSSTQKSDGAWRSATTE
jgi:hypothetical protein